MYKFINDILVIKGDRISYFFDPETLIIFSKNNLNEPDEKVLAAYQASKKNVVQKNQSVNIYKREEFSRVTLELHVTDTCNLRCKYCYFDKSCQNKRKKRQMSRESIEKAFRFTLRSFPNVQLVDIVLYGGEPLLFWKNFEFLIEKAKDVFQEKKIIFGFPTNGTIVNAEILAFLKQHKISFQLSWDGREKEQNLLRPTAKGKGSYQILDKNLLRFKSINNSLSVRITITPHNMNMTDLFTLFKEKGFRRIVFCLCSSEVNDLSIKEKDLPNLFHELDNVSSIYLKHLIEDDLLIQILPFQRFFRILHFGEKKNIYCGAGRNLFAVSPEETLYSCHRMIGNSKFQLGSLEKGFEKKDTLFVNKKPCENCFAKFLCAGGCHHEHSGNFSSISCHFTKYVLYLSVKMYAELMLQHPNAFIKLTNSFDKTQSNNAFSDVD